MEKKDDLGKIKVIMGLSGGVDSSVAALLLKRAGFSVAGVYLKCYWTYEGCQSDQDRNSAARVASVLDIPFEVWDFEKEYRKTVVDYFYDEYKKGRTPNPDVVCNREIKFGLFLRKALGNLGDLGNLPARNADSIAAAGGGTEKDGGRVFIATGHYARVGIKNQESRIKGEKAAETIIFPKFSQYEEVRDNGGIRYAGIGEYLGYLGNLGDLGGDGAGICGKLSLFGGVSAKKDQSYFLYDIPQSAYEHILYPLGNLTKKQVREIASDFNLPTANRPDSTGICFIGEVNVEKFLKERIAESRGNVVDKKGNIIGEHKGAVFYTIGQRHGFRINNLSLGYHISSEPAVDVGKEQNPSTSFLSLPAHSLRTVPKNSLKSFPSEAAWASSEIGILRGRKNAEMAPWYVIGKNMEKNELIVGMGEECKTDRFRVEIGRNDQLPMTNLQRDPSLRIAQDDGGVIYVRIRNLGDFIPCEVEAKEGELKVKLAYPVFGIAPGQSAVFYRMVENSDAVWEVVGGGVIQ